MSKGEKNQEKDSQQAESVVGGDLNQSQKNIDQSNKKVFKADGQNDEWGGFSWKKPILSMKTRMGHWEQCWLNTEMP